MSDRPTVWLSERDRRALSTFALQWAPRETGGILLGYWRADERDLVITEVIGPGEGARHGDASFEPDGAYHIEVVERAYRDSGRAIVYVGDWHSHPAGSTALSDRDVRTLIAIARDRRARIRRPVMGVVGGSDAEDFALWMAEPPWFPWLRRWRAQPLAVTVHRHR